MDWLHIDKTLSKARADERLNVEIIGKLERELAEGRLTADEGARYDINLDGHFVCATLYLWPQPCQKNAKRQASRR